MLSAVFDTVIGSALKIILMVLALLPTIDIASLPISAPEPVQDALGALNWFVPIGDLVTILTVWIGAILAVNVAMIIYQALSSVRR